MQNFINKQSGFGSEHTNLEISTIISRFGLISTNDYYHSQPTYKKVFYIYIKQFLDILLSLTLIFFSLPVAAAIIVVIKATSRGPIFFRHKRLGKNGVEFDCLKFRTMVSNAEELLKNDAELKQRFEEKFKIENDPRITRVGKFLRCTSLDELPQLVNVLRGEMSLIGPRPVVREELEKYSIYASKLTTVKPGLGGLWQATGRSDTTYGERVLLDMYYIDNRNLLFDLELLFMTAITVIIRAGAR